MGENDDLPESVRAIPGAAKAIAHLSGAVRGDYVAWLVGVMARGEVVPTELRWSYTFDCVIVSTDTPAKPVLQELAEERARRAA